MKRFIVMRILQSIIAIFGISIAVFILARASGDPAVLMISNQATPEDLARIRKDLGLDKSLTEQYGIFLGKLIKGDLGKSLHNPRPVSELISLRLGNSLRLVLLAFIIGMLLALFLGVLSAIKRDSVLDNVVKFLAISGQAVPSFWLALMAMIVLSVKLKLLPTSGMGGPANYVLPVSILVFFLLPGMMRLVRSSMLDVLDSEYIKLARIKGLPEKVVIWKHALRNALIAPLTAAGMILAGMITNTIVIETVFVWPGIGRLLTDAVLGRDFPVVQGITLLIAVVVLSVNLLVDIAYAYIDPQIRFQRT